LQIGSSTWGQARLALVCIFGSKGKNAAKLESSRLWLVPSLLFWFVNEVKAVMSGITIARFIGPAILLFTWGMIGYDIYLKKHPKKLSQEGGAPTSAEDLTLLGKAPAIRIDYIGGTVGTLILKNDRDSPAIIRRVGNLISREEYESSYALSVSPEVIPQVEKGHPVECKVYGVSSPGASSTSLEAVLRGGNEYSIDSVLIDYDDCDGNQFSRLFLLTRNTDDSVVFVPEPVALRGHSKFLAPQMQNLFNLRHELAVGKYAQRSLGRPSDIVLSDEEKIKITLPLDGESLIDKQPLGANSFSYAVRGKLKSLPKGCKIWLLTADEEGKQYWPQGFYPMQYNEATGDWNGRVHVGNSPVQITALVAPSTSQQLFHYFQKRGDETKFYSPLDRIPAECQNVASVRARVL